MSQEIATDLAAIRAEMKEMNGQIAEVRALIAGQRTSKEKYLTAEVAEMAGKAEFTARGCAVVVCSPGRRDSDGRLMDRGGSAAVTSRRLALANPVLSARLGHRTYGYAVSTEASTLTAISRLACTLPQ